MPEPDPNAAATRWSATNAPRGDDYDRRWDEMAAAGQDPHGEATFVMRFAPRRVLDAGCGTGRVARELARRGVDVVGVDVDVSMLETARRRAPELAWHAQDLASLALDAAPFDLAVLAGNVMIFVAPGTEGTVLARIVAHLTADGLVVAGFQLRPGGLDLAAYDAHATAAGLALVERWSTWSCDPFVPAGAEYAVSVHRRIG